MPVPTLSPTPPTVPAPARRRLAVGLAVTAALAVAAAVTSAPAVLALALVVLAAVAAGGLSAQWRAAAPRGARPVAVPAPTAEPADLTARLRRLRADYVQKVNAALDAGREDLARELSDEYADQSLRLITGAAPERPAAPQLPLTPLHHSTQEDDVHLTATLKTLLRRFDRYTLEAFRPAAPYRNELVRSGR